MILAVTRFDATLHCSAEVIRLRQKIKTIARPVLPALRWMRRRRTRMQSQAWLERIAPQFGGFAGKVVLDVGADLSGDMIVTLEQRFAAREVVGINLAAENTKLSSTTRLEQGNILETRYSDATFDLIVSSS